MPTPFRLIAGYDGSEAAADMLDELGRAGLPDSVDATVLSVAERWLPPPSMYETIGSHEVPHAKPSQQIAAEGVHRLRKLHPLWQVSPLAESGSPARLLVRTAREQSADLIALGALGHGALEQVLVGSISRKVANSASCSVRVSRGYLPDRAGPVRLLLAHDGHPGADTAVARVASRLWPAGSEVHLVVCPATHSPDEERHWTQHVLNRAGDLLRQSGLLVVPALLYGDPRRSIPEHARRISAECVFIGDNDRSVVERLLLGTVASAILSRAPCSVEICR